MLETNKIGIGYFATLLLAVNIGCTSDTDISNLSLPVYIDFEQKANKFANNQYHLLKYSGKDEIEEGTIYYIKIPPFDSDNAYSTSLLPNFENPQKLTIEKCQDGQFCRNTSVGISKSKSVMSIIGLGYEIDVVPQRSIVTLIFFPGQVGTTKSTSSNPPDVLPIVWYQNETQREKALLSYQSIVKSIWN